MKQSNKLKLFGSIVLKIVVAIILMLVISSILSIPVIIYTILNTEVPLENVTAHVFEAPIPGLLSASAQFVGVLLTVLIMRLWTKQSFKEMGWTKFWRSKGELLFGLLLGFASITIIFFLLWSTGQIFLEATSLLQPTFTSAFFIGFLTFVFVALNEELFFRGYIISVLKPTHSKVMIYVVSAVIFSCAHLFNANVHVLGLINIVLIGLLFAYMFLKTTRLWMPIGYHLTWNFFQGNVWGFQVSGTHTTSLYQPEIRDTILTGGSFGPEAGLLTTILIVVGFLITRWFIHTRE